jgi:hypothetical protein
LPRIAGPAAANSATAARSDQSGIGWEEQPPDRRRVVVGQVIVGGPGATGPVAARVSSQMSRLGLGFAPNAGLVLAFDRENVSKG